MTTRKRSSAVPLTLVPALAAAVGCGGPQTVSGVDPCLPQVYNEALCQTAVRQQGYYHQGMWYHHAYGMPFLFYRNNYAGYVQRGGRVRSLPAGNYSSSYRGPSGGRTTVVRGGFGGIGGTRGFGGG